jgi:hypothetical protein
MSVRAARNFVFVIVGLVFLIGAAVLIIGLGVFGKEAMEPYFPLVMPLFLVLMALAGLVGFFYLRCPRCKTPLTREGFRDMQCTVCGEKF